MAIKTKQKNWFRRHWIITTFICLFIVIGILATLEENTEESKNGSGLKLINSTENQNLTESDQTTECTGTFEQICINKKLDECTKLCAGEDIDLPYMKNECYSSCYQIYYYGGEKDLDDYLKELRGS